MKQQNGSALTVILVMLVMALMLGLSSIQSSLVDERMAGNYKASIQAYMGAEKAAADGVQYVNNIANSVVFDSYNIMNLHSIDWVEFTEGKGEALPAVNSSHGGACDAQVECYYRFFMDMGGEKYVAAMGAVVEGDRVIAVSEPVIVDLVSSYGGVSAALSVYGGVKNINGDILDDKGKEPEPWYPTSSNAKVAGGDFGDAESGTGSLSSMYYEGVEINLSTIKNMDPEDTFPDGYDYGGNLGQAGLDSMAFIGELYQVAMDSENVVTTLSDSDFIKKGDACSTGAGEEAISYSKFAVVDSFNFSGDKKFCGVLVFLGSDLTLGGTALVEGLVLAANPHTKTVDSSTVFDFSKRSQNVNLMINGGGSSGSVFFNETSVKQAFESIGVGENGYLDYLKGGSKSSLYTIGGWGAR
ncbi:pilus assembly PilX N-terminal domain-containing protein [Halomonas sp. YLGW01]|uniref:pilus assembly PilX family protein n=1 Tax=Halomonas sp. YLGW01 TaxID=2773308 RepID=UPI0017849657|nr:pilus assembly PilX N-terminal domain-containing protein [Halomonas sp. YLGW01]